MFPDFKTIKQLYDWGMDDNMNWYCANKFITSEQYQEITGKEYQDTTAKEN